MSTSKLTDKQVVERLARREGYTVIGEPPA